MEKEIKQCWAFHKDGARCQHPAGHNGDHVVQKTWKDIECATPGEFSQPAPPVTEKSVTAPVPVLQEAPNKCVACGHAHRDGQCKCGCHEFIG
jgi:hypothetical protein